MAQLALVLVAVFRIRRRPARGLRIVGVVLVAVGVLIGAPTLGWLLTGGPDGHSSILMRGGWFGFWLSVLTVVELLGLGLVMIASRPANDRT